MPGDLQAAVIRVARAFDDELRRCVESTGETAAEVVVETRSKHGTHLDPDERHDEALPSVGTEFVVRETPALGGQCPPVLKNRRRSRSRCKDPAARQSCASLLTTFAYFAGLPSRILVRAAFSAQRSGDAYLERV